MSKRKSYPEQPEFIFTLGALREGDVPEVKLRLNRSSRKKFLGKVESSKSAADFIRKVYKRGEIELQEQFMVLYLNRANQIIGYYRFKECKHFNYYRA
jgi:DNA repair protein RadC